MVASLTACWQSASRRDALPVDPLALLPADAAIVGGFDAKRVRASELWHQYGPTWLAETPELGDSFKASCGFDPIAALDSVTFALVRFDVDPLELVFVVRGYPKKAVLTCLRDHPPAGTSVLFKGETVTGQVSGTPVALQFVDETTAIITSGRAASPEAIAQLVARGAPLRASQAFIDRFARSIMRCSARSTSPRSSR